MYIVPEVMVMMHNEHQGYYFVSSHQSAPPATAVADLFGQRHAGAIHGRVLTAWSAAALVGPNKLTSTLEPSQFEKAFGAPVAKLESLIEAKAITIPRLMELVPMGTTDPTPVLYNTTMYGVGGMLSVALLANYLIGPIDPKFHLKPTTVPPLQPEKKA
jgi:hypothetical protein